MPLAVDIFLFKLKVSSPLYKCCAVAFHHVQCCALARYLDKLMGTTFFHESHFQGLLERVRERGRVNVAQRVADQVSRLFNQPEPGTDLNSQNNLLVAGNSVFYWNNKIKKMF